MDTNTSNRGVSERCQYGLLGQSDPQLALEQSKQILGFTSLTCHEQGPHLVHLFRHGIVSRGSGDLGEDLKDTMDMQRLGLEHGPLIGTRTFSNEANVALLFHFLLDLGQ